jgi:hypothetical protein
MSTTTTLPSLTKYRNAFGMLLRSKGRDQPLTPHERTVVSGWFKDVGVASGLYRDANELQCRAVVAKCENTRPYSEVVATIPIWPTETSANHLAEVPRPHADRTPLAVGARPLLPRAPVNPPAQGNVNIRPSDLDGEGFLAETDRPADDVPLLDLEGEGPFAETVVDTPTGLPTESPAGTEPEEAEAPSIVDRDWASDKDAIGQRFATAEEAIAAIRLVFGDQACWEAFPPVEVNAEAVEALTLLEPLFHPKWSREPFGMVVVVRCLCGTRLRLDQIRREMVCIHCKTTWQLVRMRLAWTPPVTKLALDIGGPDEEGVKEVRQ